MQIKIDNFEGPLDLLLRLIEKEELDITQISLLKVTEQYIEYLSQIKENRPEALADFLLVAVRLLYIKSKALLPEIMDEAEEEADNLAEQLKLYKKFIEASRSVEQLFISDRHAYGRQQLVLKADQFYQPPKSLTVKVLQREFLSFLAGLRAFKVLPTKTIKRVISIKEKIARILELLNQRGKVFFSDLSGGQQASKAELIVSFLGILELSKQRKVIVRQEALFSEIVVEKIK